LIILFVGLIYKPIIVLLGGGFIFLYAIIITKLEDLILARMNIRKLELKDKSQMLKLMNEFWMKNDRGELLNGNIKEINALKDPINQMRIELGQYFNWYSFVAEEGSQLLGFVSGRVYSESEHVLDKIGYIEELFVIKSARGKKLGKQLMRKIIDMLIEQGCVVIRTSAYSNNTVALNLYRSIGFIDEAVELTCLSKDINYN